MSYRILGQLAAAAEQLGKTAVAGGVELLVHASVAASLVLVSQPTRAFVFPCQLGNVAMWPPAAASAAASLLPAAVFSASPVAEVSLVVFAVLAVAAIPAASVSPVVFAIPVDVVSQFPAGAAPPAAAANLVGVAALADAVNPVASSPPIPSAAADAEIPAVGALPAAAGVPVPVSEPTAASAVPAARSNAATLGLAVEGLVTVQAVVVRLAVYGL